MRHQRKNNFFSRQHSPGNNASYNKIDFGTYVCPLCGNIISDLTAAIDYGEGHQPAHLDCVLNLLSEQENVPDNQRLIYIGAGQFAIVSFSPEFRIIKRIAYETKEFVPEWRNNIKKIFFQSNKIQ
jgi:hypothetical protein